MTASGHWTERLPGGRRPGFPAWLWPGITVGLLLLWAAADLIAFALDSAPAEAPLRYWWRRAVLAALFGWIVASSRWAVDGSLRDLEALRPLLRLGPREVDALRAGFLTSAPLPRRACAALGALLGLALSPLSQADAASSLRESGFDYAFLLGSLHNAAMFALLGGEAWGTLEASRVYAKIEAAIGEIDLLDPDLLEPFARRGLRAASFWIIGSGLGALVFVSEGIGAPILAIVTATVGVGIATLVLPMRGAHRRIRAAKRAELERTRAAIRAERGKLLGGDARPTRLAELLAYEARIERVREWPIDLPILLRFSGLLALAVGSWLGGAIVERVLALLW